MFLRWTNRSDIIVNDDEHSMPFSCHLFNAILGASSSSSPLASLSLITSWEEVLKCDE